MLTKLERRPAKQTGGDQSNAIRELPENSSGFLTPLRWEAVREPCSSSGFCSCHSAQEQKLQVGQLHWEAPEIFPSNL